MDTNNTCEAILPAEWPRGRHPDHGLSSTHCLRVPRVQHLGRGIVRGHGWPLTRLLLTNLAHDSRTSDSHSSILNVDELPATNTVCVCGCCAPHLAAFDRLRHQGPTPLSPAGSVAPARPPTRYLRLSSNIGSRETV